MSSLPVFTSYSMDQVLEFFTDKPNNLAHKFSVKLNEDVRAVAQRLDRSKGIAGRLSNDPKVVFPEEPDMFIPPDVCYFSLFDTGVDKVKAGEGLTITLQTLLAINMTDGVITDMSDTLEGPSVS